MAEEEKKQIADNPEDESHVGTALSAVEDYVNRDETQFVKLDWKAIVGGEFLNSKFVRKQIKLILLIVFFLFIYISNRYISQHEIIEISQLKEQLKDIKYDALTRSSELTERSRQSHVEKYLKEKGDSLLKISTVSPFIIRSEK
jgi:uncharacterized membrane protein